MAETVGDRAGHEFGVSPGLACVVGDCLSVPVCKRQEIRQALWPTDHNPQVRRPRMR